VDTQALKQEDRRYILHPWAVQSALDPLVVTGGRGAYFWDADGRQYLDLASELCYLNLGFQHPKVVEAIKRQADQLCVAGPQHANEPAIKLAKLLSEITPGDLSRVLFTAGGSESNEIAVQIARLYTGRHKVITRYRSYHGSTLGAITLSGDPRRWQAEPGAVGVVRALDNYCYRCPFGQEYPGCRLECAEQFEEIIRLEGPEVVAAVLVEPVPGGSGVMVPPEGYLKRLREICDRYGVLLIADEVITGFGRTGQWFGCDNWQVVPDIMTMAKGISSGYLPLGAVVVSSKIGQFLEDRFLHCGFTFSSHPLACAAGVATIEAYRDEGLVENARAMGQGLMAGLRDLQARHPAVGEVRGLGLLACIELVKSRQTKEPLSFAARGRAPNELQREVQGRLLERGVYAILRSNFIFVWPPLCIREAELGYALQALDYALGAADRHAV